MTPTEKAAAEKLRAKKYNEAIAKAKECLAKKDYEGAVKNFQDAAKIETTKEAKEAAQKGVKDAEKLKAANPAKAEGAFKKIVNKIAGMFEKFATAALKDGTEITYEGELAPGTLVMMTADGNQIPMPDGEYPLGGEFDGKMIIVGTDENGNEGVIIEIKDAVAAAEQNAADLDAIAEAIAKPLESLAKAVEKHMKDTNEKFALMAEGIVSGKLDKTKFTRTSVATVVNTKVAAVKKVEKKEADSDDSGADAFSYIKPLM